MKEDMQREWRVEPCRCANDICRKVHIEPGVVTAIEASIDRDLGEHIVMLHNMWLDEGNAIAKEGPSCEISDESCAGEVGKPCGHDLYFCEYHRNPDAQRPRLGFPNYEEEDKRGWVKQAISDMKDMDERRESKK